MKDPNMYGLQGMNMEGRGEGLLRGVAREVLSSKECLREEAEPQEVLGEAGSGQRNGKCKYPEAEVCTEK